MITDLDLKILIEFSKLKSNEESSTWDIMKKIFKQECSTKNNMLIQYRIKRMAELDLFKINGKEIRTYTLNSNNVYYKNFNFPCGAKRGIAVFIEGKWEIFEL